MGGNFSVKNWTVRLAGIFVLGMTAWYLPWVLSHLNRQALWLSIPFGVASILMAIMTLVTALNHWRNSVSPVRVLPVGQEKAVVVIIPTYGEPAQMVYETARSVLEQDYPRSKIRLVISDDGRSAAIRALVARLRSEYPDGYIGYHEPPRRGDPTRRGEAKAGNLNSAFDVVKRHAPSVDFIETRDADDLVGDPSFLRQALGQLVADPKLGFVQTIKEVKSSPNDPFGNQETLFYRRAMLAKNAANAVFPCGSGLVWRREALEHIGGFPSWNLVEDLQSGVEALRRGWKGLYLPIVGAVGQIAPEDIPNAVKQRGTWALDTMRLTLWGHRRGLSLAQHIQFSELGFFYMLSFAVLVFAIVPIFTLTLHIYPVITTHADYAIHFWPYAIAVELLLVSMAEGLPYEHLWRARQIWLGMAPVYVKASILALIFGPNRKPTYRVTRKEHVYAWYWREILPQLVIFLGLIAASIYHLATHSLLTDADLGSLFWAGFFILGFSRIVFNSWHGLNPFASLVEPIKQGWQSLILQDSPPLRRTK